GDLLRRQAAQIGHHPMGGHAVVTAIALDELGVFVAFAVAANTGDAQMHSSYLHLHTINVHIKRSLITVVSTEHLQPCEHKQLSHDPDQIEGSVSASASGVSERSRSGTARRRRGRTPSAQPSTLASYWRMRWSTARRPSKSTVTIPPRTGSRAHKS